MMQVENAKPLGGRLLEAGLINQRQLVQALQIQAKTGDRLAKVLVSHGYLGKGALHKFIRSQIHVGSIHLQNYDVCQDSVKILSRTFAVEHEVLAIDQVRHHLSLAMTFPLDDRTVSEVEEMTGYKVNRFLCSLDDLEFSIGRHYAKAVLSLQDLAGGFSMRVEPISACA